MSERKVTVSVTHTVTIWANDTWNDEELMDFAVAIVEDNTDDWEQEGIIDTESSDEVNCRIGDEEDEEEIIEEIITTESYIGEW